MKKLAIGLGSVILALSTSAFAANKVTIDFSNAQASGQTMTAQSSDVLDAGQISCTGKNLPKGAKVKIIDENNKVLTTFQNQEAGQFTHINPTVIAGIVVMVVGYYNECQHEGKSCPIVTCIIDRHIH